VIVFAVLFAPMFGLIAYWLRKPLRG
jgi:hypothetical protein